MKYIGTLLVLIINLNSQDLDQFKITFNNVGEPIQGVRKGFSKILVQSPIGQINFSVQFSDRNTDDFIITTVDGGYELLLNINKLAEEGRYSDVILGLNHTKHIKKELILNLKPGRSYTLVIQSDRNPQGLLAVSIVNSNVIMTFDGKLADNFLKEGENNIYALDIGKRLLVIEKNTLPTYKKIVTIVEGEMINLGSIDLLNLDNVNLTNPEKETVLKSESDKSKKAKAHFSILARLGAGEFTKVTKINPDIESLDNYMTENYSSGIFNLGTSYHFGQNKISLSLFIKKNTEGETSQINNINVYYTYVLSLTETIDFNPGLGVYAQTFITENDKGDSYTNLESENNGAYLQLELLYHWTENFDLTISLASFEGSTGVLYIGTEYSLFDF